MSDIHPNNLRGKLDALDEEEYDEEMNNRRYLDAITVILRAVKCE